MLNYDDYDSILTSAYVLYRKSRTGAQGQIIEPSDHLDYWVMVATFEYLKEREKDDA